MKQTTAIIPRQLDGQGFGLQQKQPDAALIKICSIKSMIAPIIPNAIDGLFG